MIGQESCWLIVPTAFGKILIAGAKGKSSILSKGHHRCYRRQPFGKIPIAGAEGKSSILPKGHHRCYRRQPSVLARESRHPCQNNVIDAIWKRFTLSIWSYHCWADKYHNHYMERAMVSTQWMRSLSFPTEYCCPWSRMVSSRVVTLGRCLGWGPTYPISSLLPL